MNRRRSLGLSRHTIRVYTGPMFGKIGSTARAADSRAALSIAAAAPLPIGFLAAFAVVAVTACGCGGGQAASGASSGDEQQGSRIRVGPYGELSVEHGAQAADASGPSWLESLRPGDVLVYRVRTADGREQDARFRVQKLVRRGHGVAARMEPVAPGIDSPAATGYWIAGDETALYRLEAHAALADPGFIPLDDGGRVVPEGRADARWRIPAEWKNEMEGDSSQRESVEQGWVVDELEMTLEGPVRGDSCARISRTGPDGFVRLVVCANIGMVELESGSSEEIPEESWKLVATEGGD